RDTVYHLPPSELAPLIQDLPIEKQTTIFRILPRRLAAATFEYLPLKEQEEMVRALAQEDVAAILNEMSPDDRTMLLEELPAAATRQMLAMLNDEERAEAVKLLGYPEGSVGSFMTPHYIAVRPHSPGPGVLGFVPPAGEGR